MVLKAIYDFVVLLLKIIWALIVEMFKNIPSVFFALYILYGVYMLNFIHKPIDNDFLFLGLIIVANYIGHLIKDKK